MPTEPQRSLMVMGVDGPFPLVDLAVSRSPSGVAHAIADPEGGGPDMRCGVRASWAWSGMDALDRDETLCRRCAKTLTITGGA